MIECTDCAGDGWFSPTPNPDDGWECVLCGGAGELPWPRASGDKPGKSAAWSPDGEFVEPHKEFAKAWALVKSGAKVDRRGDGWWVKSRPV